MLSNQNRRWGTRLPLEMYLNAFVEDQPTRGVTYDISERGLYLNTLAAEPLQARTPVGLEFNLPGISETIWAAGEICFESLDDYFLGRGVRFVAMASAHERMIRDFCFRLRMDRLKQNNSSTLLLPS